MSTPNLRFYRPAEKLQTFISSYYFLDIAEGPTIQDMNHPEWANIRFVLSGHWTARLGSQEASSADLPASLHGPTSRPVRVTGTPPTRTVGVGVLPVGWAHLIGRPAHLHSDRIASLEEAFPGDAAEVHAALARATNDEMLRGVLDDFFLALHASRPEPSPLPSRAHALLLDPATTTAQSFAAGLGLSSRHVARLSLDMFGFAPKLLLRRQRFLRTLDMMRARLDEPWARLLDETYYDQSHFVRDCRRFMEMSPTEYFALPRILLDPAARLRQQTIGQTLQALHPASPRR